MPHTVHMAHKNAATHSGHCQCCGRLQKLPGGVLSQHGYKVTHGYFSGVCRGARYKAFEEACDQVQRYIEEAKVYRAALVEIRDRLLMPATENLAWVHNYEQVGGYGRNSYVWRQVELLYTEKESHGCKWLDISFMAPGTRDNGRVTMRYLAPHDTRGAKTILEAVTVLNEKRANAYTREIGQLDSYIAWQQARVDGWKPAPLLPVTHKDKEGFRVE